MTDKGFSAEEKAAMKERARELKANAKAADAEADALQKISEMPSAERAIAERIHELVKQHTPELQAKTWYGQPAYTKNGEVVFFFQSAAKFSTRYSTLGFSDAANLDDGSMWPTSYALTGLTPADEKLIIALITKAAG